MDTWLRTDEALEAVLSLELVSDSLPKILDNSHYWKWVLISLRNALQGYMVLALKGSNSLNVLTKECAEKWIAAWKNHDSIFPERKLDSFLNLYKKIKKGRKQYEEEIRLGHSHTLKRTRSDLMLMYANSQPFKPRGTQTQSVKMLNDLRNEFIHFLPKGLSLQASGLPQVVEDCVDIIEFLAFKCGNVLWHDGTLKLKTKELVDGIMQQIQEIDKHKPS